MKKFFPILLASLLILPVLVFAQSEKKKAVYFYSDTCPRCQNVDKYFQDSGLYDRYDIQKLNVYSDDNLAKLNGLFDAYGIAPENRAVPIVFFDRKFLAGDVPIIRDFAQEVENSETSFFPDATIIKNLTQMEKDAAIKQQKKYISSIPLSVIAGAALLDVFNPCSLAVLVMLVLFLISFKTGKRIFLLGLLFALAIFCSHFLAALGGYSSLNNVKLQKLFAIFVGGVAFLVGLANLKNILLHKKSRFF